MEILLQLCHFILQFLMLLLLCNHARWCSSLAYKKVILIILDKRQIILFCDFWVKSQHLGICSTYYLVPSLFIRYLLPWQCMSQSFSLHHVFISHHIPCKFWLTLFDNCHHPSITSTNISLAWNIWVRWLSRMLIHKFKILNNFLLSD